MRKLQNLLLQNAQGDMLRDENFLEHVKRWRENQPEDSSFGPIINHTWQIDGASYERANPRNDHLRRLPDASGFLLCENVERSDNLVLLDVYGHERMRLSIPWHLTRTPTSASVDYPSRFIGMTIPWDNPQTGEPGQFAVLAWVQYAGDYAFELDWRTGQFLWGYYLERG